MLPITQQHMKDKPHETDRIQKMFLEVASLEFNCSGVPSYKKVGISMNDAAFRAARCEEPALVACSVYFLNSKIEYSTSGQLDLFASLFNVTILASTVALEK